MPAISKAIKTVLVVTLHFKGCLSEAQQCDGGVAEEESSLIQSQLLRKSEGQFGPEPPTEAPSSVPTPAPPAPTPAPEPTPPEPAGTCDDLPNYKCFSTKGFCLDGEKMNCAAGTVCDDKDAPPGDSPCIDQEPPVPLDNVSSAVAQTVSANGDNADVCDEAPTCGKPGTKYAKEPCKYNGACSPKVGLNCSAGSTDCTKHFAAETIPAGARVHLCDGRGGGMAFTLNQNRRRGYVGLGKYQSNNNKYDWDIDTLGYKTMQSKAKFKFRNKGMGSEGMAYCYHASDGRWAAIDATPTWCKDDSERCTWAVRRFGNAEGPKDLHYGDKLEFISPQDNKVMFQYQHWFACDRDFQSGSTYQFKVPILILKSGTPCP